MQFSLTEESWAICTCPSSESPAYEPRREPAKPEQSVLTRTFLWDGCQKLLTRTVEGPTVSDLVPCLENLFHDRFTALPKQRRRWQHCAQDALPALDPREDFGVTPPLRSGHGKKEGADNWDGKTKPARPATPAKGQQGALALTQLPLTALWYGSRTTAASDHSVLCWQESLQPRSTVRSPLPNRAATENLAEMEGSWSHKKREPTEAEARVSLSKCNLHLGCFT